MGGSYATDWEGLLEVQRVLFLGRVELPLSPAPLPGERGLVVAPPSPLGEGLGMRGYGGSAESGIAGRDNLWLQRVLSSPRVGCPLTPGPSPEGEGWARDFLEGMPFDPQS
ncbi:MAG: hypothetical protein CMF04_01445 [Hyphomonas sp.]|nr:hypothetical protein [Hyphomonas sp.]